MQEPAETISGTYQQYVPFLQQSSFLSLILSVQKLLREKRLLFDLQDIPEIEALGATGAKFIWSCSKDTRPCHPLDGGRDSPVQEPFLLV
nr:hypothetical protein [uncultured Sphaerochaeta sp.]